MGEHQVIESTPMPATAASLCHDLQVLGVVQGDTLIVHCSMKTIGWVVGGAAAVVDSLLSAVGPTGTVTMPAHSGDWSDPAEWSNPPVPSTWWPIITHGRPHFDPYATPLRGMGAVAENLLLRRSTLRSTHPLHSHMANGRLAEQVVGDHPFEDSFGDRSPLGHLYEIGAKVLLLGVGHGQNTSLHLAERRALWPGKSEVEHHSRVMTDNGPATVRWTEIAYDADDFDDMGRDIEHFHDVKLGRVGLAESRLIDMRSMVDAAVKWLEEHRS